jgi:hypothetical protein
VIRAHQPGPALKLQKSWHGRLKSYVAVAVDGRADASKGWHKIPVRSSHGILQEVQTLLQKYRSELVKQSRLLDPEPIDIPETIPNPIVVPKPTPTPTEPAPKEPVRIPERVPGTARVACSAGV